MSHRFPNKIQLVHLSEFQPTMKPIHIPACSINTFTSIHGITNLYRFESFLHFVLSKSAKSIRYYMYVSFTCPLFECMSLFVFVWILSSVWQFFEIKYRPTCTCTVCTVCKHFGITNSYLLGDIYNKSREEVMSKFCWDSTKVLRSIKAWNW